MITKIKNNPGLFPHKLGTAKTQIDKWALIKNIDYSSIIQEYEWLQQNVENMKANFNKLPHGNTYNQELQNYYLLLNITSSEIKRKLKQIFPKREKRGLMDGLGTVFKFLTGNLDSTDGQKYERAIEELRKGHEAQNKIITEQISITDQILDKVNKTISTLRIDQITLTSRIMQLENEIKQNKIHDAETYSLINMHSVFLQISGMMNLILHLVNTLEEAITFSRLEVMHPSIIDPEDLEANLRFIQNKLSEEQLVFEIKQENIALFEEIITVKAYQISTRIVFIMEIPLTNTDTYDYYHLYPLPVKSNDHFQIIIPQKKYLLYNEENYISTDETCKQLQNNNYLCKIQEQLKTEDPLCEAQLISFVKINECKPTIFTLKHFKTQKITQDSWLVITNKELITSLTCENNKKKLPLDGDYLIQIPPTCSLKIEDKLLKTNQYTNSINEVMELPMANVTPITKEEITEQLPSIHLESIELDDIYALRNKLKQLPKKLYTPNFNVDSHISGFVFFIITLIIIIIMFALYKYNKLPKYCNRIKIEIPPKPIQIVP